MAERKFDFDLCRKILLRLEELLAVPGSNTPTQYVFEGYRHSDVAHYIRKMGDDDMVHVRLRSGYAPDQLQHWPVAFREKGVAFLDYAKDEKIWNQAMEEMRGRNDTPTLEKDEDSFEGSRGGGEKAKQLVSKCARYGESTLQMTGWRKQREILVRYRERNSAQMTSIK